MTTTKAHGLGSFNSRHLLSFSWRLKPETQVWAGLGPPEDSLLCLPTAVLPRVFMGPSRCVCLCPDLLSQGPGPPCSRPTLVTALSPDCFCKGPAPNTAASWGAGGQDLQSPSQSLRGDHEQMTGRWQSQKHGWPSNMPERCANQVWVQTTGASSLPTAPPPLPPCWGPWCLCADPSERRPLYPPGSQTRGPTTVPGPPGDRPAGLSGRPPARPHQYL